MSGVSLEICFGMRKKNLASWRIGNRESLKMNDFSTSLAYRCLNLLES